MYKDDKTKLRATEGKKNDSMSGNMGEFFIKFTKSHKAPEKGGRFLIKYVKMNGKVVWRFEDEHFDGLAIFEELDGIYCICLVSKRGDVKKVIPFDAFQESVEQAERIKKLIILAKEKIKPF